MKIYTVKRTDGTQEEVYTLTEAKRILKSDPGSRAFGFFISKDGDFESIGEVKLNGRNSFLMAGSTKRKTERYD